jgi:hypothetical protein
LSRARSKQQLASFEVPTQLREYGVKLSGAFMAPRGPMSWKDRKTKAEQLLSWWTLIAAKALPRPGDPVKDNDAASQLYLGFIQGLDRSTINRRLRKFAGKDAKVAHLFNKKRGGVGCVNRYTHRFVPSTDKHTRLLDMDPENLAAIFGADLFDAGAGEGYRGSGPVARWTHDGNVPKTIRCVCKLGQMKFYADRGCLKCGGKGYTTNDDKMGDSPRLILDVLQLKGIAEWGHLDMTCKAIGELTGLCENTVAAGLDEWENLKILQIVPGKVYYEEYIDPKTGKQMEIRRDPQRIIFLPGQLMDHDVQHRELQRFQEALERARRKFGSTQVLAIAQQRHAQLLQMWLLSRHSVGSLWTYLYTWLRRKENIVFTVEGAEQEQISMLFPLHKGWNDG